MGRTRRQPEAELSELQLAVMRVLWERGEATVLEVQEALRPARDLAPTTVATTLGRLEKRAVVAHRRDGRVFVYRALVPEDEVRRTMVGALTERLFRGDPAALVSHLLREGDIDARDLDRIKQSIERRRRREES
jgi:BlaI family penicillinase repressor